MRGLVLAVTISLAQAPAAAGQSMVLVRCSQNPDAACGSVDLTIGAAGVRQLVGLDSAALADGWKARFLRGTDLPVTSRPIAVNSSYRVLVLLDVSGSMKGTKIGSARLVLRQFVGSLDSIGSGSIRVAVAPFGSVDVTDRIDQVEFAPPDSALADIDGLPAPGRENTALYSAAFFGAARLARELERSGPGATGLLVIITDGDNDVGRGDDPGLLTGTEGLSVGAAGVAKVPIWVGIAAIGPLTRGPLDQLAGGRGVVLPLSSTPGPFELGQSLVRLRRFFQSRWEVEVGLAPMGRADLGRQWAQMGIDHGEASNRREIGRTVWRPPLVALPAFSARTATGAGVDGGVGLAGRLVALLIPTLLVGLVLIQAWVVLPRVLWPTKALVVGEIDPAAPAPVPFQATVVRPGQQEAPPRKPTEVTASKGRPV